MTTQVFARNPSNYIKELLEVGHAFIAWDRGYLTKKRIDPFKFARLYYGNLPWRALVIGDPDQGAADIDADHDTQRPAAVYPVWEYGESIALLEELLESPVGEDPAACEDERVPRPERPVLGQEHRVVVTGIPHLNTGPGRAFMRTLSELQEEHPHAIIHVHGLYSFKVMFGLNFRSVDIDPRTPASKGDVMLPNGKPVRFEAAAKWPQWVTLCGYNPVDLAVPRNRCIYNVRSALWAAENFGKNVKFKSTGRVEVDPEQPDTKVEPATTNYVSKKSADDGDKLICDVCSIQNSCKYFRQGAVCSVPGTEPARLASMFKTRNAETIIDGLGNLMAAQANRVERGLQDEEFGEELDPHVSTLINSLFNNGVKMVKLLDPKRNGSGTQVGVFVNGGNAAVASSPQQLTAAIVAELESKGVARQDITPEMIASVLDPDARAALPAQANRIIEGQE